MQVPEARAGGSGKKSVLARFGFRDGWGKRGDFGEWLDCCYWTGRKGSFVGEMIDWCKAEGAVLILAV